MISKSNLSIRTWLIEKVATPKPAMLIIKFFDLIAYGLRIPNSALVECGFRNRATGRFYVSLTCVNLTVLGAESVRKFYHPHNYRTGLI